MSYVFYRLWHTGVTFTAEPSAVSFINLHPTKTHIEGENYYADRLFSNCLRAAVIMTLNTHTENKAGTSCGWSR